mgnify:CR=1 FL=1
MNATELFDRYLPKIEAALVQYLPADAPDNASLAQAMRYAVVGGGKRIRPVLLLAFCEAAGGDPDSALPYACALELIHSYSLIHDDLPCMDNDDLRRGKPSTHKAFGEATALLAGDGLLTRAFEVMLLHGTNPRGGDAAGCLAAAAGYDGMVGGQAIDLASEQHTIPLERLERLDDGKTVALIRAACEMGCILADRDDLRAAARAYAHGVGMAFQICDDLLDIESTTEQLGKPTGSDAANQKSTYVSLLGLEGARAAAESYTAQAVQAAAALGTSGAPLATLAELLFRRKK